MKTTLSLILVFLAAAASAASFTAIAPMTVARSFHTSTVLQDGRVFIAGGNLSDARCEIYDPATGAFRVTASLSHPRIKHTATLLSDGRVLIAGGNVTGGLGVDDTAEIFDPHLETFTPAGTMVAGRYSHTATRLLDGRVLLTGGAEAYNSGFSIGYKPQVHTEIYNPATNLFSAAPDMQAGRWNHTATRLQDGRVLIVGAPPGGTTGLPNAEMFDAGATTVQTVPNASARSQHSATLLNDGRVLLAGGNYSFVIPRVDAEIFQPSNGAFQAATGALTASVGHTATLLLDGRVLLAGWADTGESSAAAIFDPATGSVSTTASMTEPRRGHAASRLPDGRVLITGGNGATAEIFDPAGGTAVERRRSAKH